MPIDMPPMNTSEIDTNEIIGEDMARPAQEYVQKEVSSEESLNKFMEANGLTVKADMPTMEYKKHNVISPDEEIGDKYEKMGTDTQENADSDQVASAE